jgi:hypothetical protein
MARRATNAVAGMSRFLGGPYHLANERVRLALEAAQAADQEEAACAIGATTDDRKA